MTRVLRARDRVATPWKNGGGKTTEVAAFPPGASLEDFGWRVSIAEIARSGPFSLFPGIDRKLVLLKGHVALTIAGQGTTELAPDAPPIAFPGDVAAEAQILEGPATDLNVMARRSTFEASVVRKTCTGKLVAVADVTLLFSLSAVRILGETMAPADALLLEDNEAIELVSAAEFYWIEISSSSV